MSYTGKTIRLNREACPTEPRARVDFWKWYTRIVVGVNVVLVIICWWLIILGL